MSKIKRRLKCWEGNYDGLRRGLVISTSQKKAAKVIGCGVKQLADYYTCLFEIPTGFLEDTLYTRPYDGPGNWVEGRCQVVRQ